MLHSNVYWLVIPKYRFFFSVLRIATKASFKNTREDRPEHHKPIVYLLQLLQSHIVDIPMQPYKATTTNLFLKIISKKSFILSHDLHVFCCLYHFHYRIRWGALIWLTVVISSPVRGRGRVTCWPERTLQQQLFKARWLSLPVKVLMLLQQCGAADKDWLSTAKNKGHGCNLGDIARVCQVF